MSAAASTNTVPGNPVSRRCPTCGAEVGEYCKRPSGHTLYGALFHPERLRLAGHYDPVVLHDESACLLCGTELPDKDPIEAMSEVGGFHVSVDGVGHTGALCYPCYFPDGFWRRVEQKIRNDERRGATGQPALFEATADGAATG